MTACFGTVTKPKAAAAVKSAAARLNGYQRTLMADRQCLLCETTVTYCVEHAQITCTSHAQSKDHSKNQCKVTGEKVITHKLWTIFFLEEVSSRYQLLTEGHKVRWLRKVPGLVGPEIARGPTAGLHLVDDKC